MTSVGPQKKTKKRMIKNARVFIFERNLIPFFRPVVEEMTKNSVANSVTEADRKKLFPM